MVNLGCHLEIPGKRKPKVEELSLSECPVGTFSRLMIGVGGPSSWSAAPFLSWVAMQKT